MTENFSITKKELLELYSFMEAANSLFHQPMNYDKSELIEKFAEQHYSTIHKFYYEVLWDKLPQDAKERIMDE